MQPDELMAQLQSCLSALEQENTQLRTQLRSCQRSLASQLQHSETRYRRLFEQSPLSMEVYSLAGRPQLVNQAWETLFNAFFEEIPADYNVFQDTQILDLGLSSEIERVLAKEPVVMPPIVYDARRHGSETFAKTWVQAIFYPIKDEADKVVEVVQICQDLTHGSRQNRRGRQHKLRWCRNETASWDTF